jgi:hypothetical protein
MREINIPTTVDSIFKQYITIVNGVLSKKNRLTSLEIDILDKMLYIDYRYKHLSKDKRDAIIFHPETRKKIISSVYEMSTASYWNIITKLRKKGMIDGRSLKIYIPIEDNKIKLQFNLIITE